MWRWFKFSPAVRLSFSGSTDDHEDVEEEVDDVQVDVEGSEHVLLRVQGVLVFACKQKRLLKCQLHRNFEEIKAIVSRITKSFPFSQFRHA